MTNATLIIPFRLMATKAIANARFVLWVAGEGHNPPSEPR